MRVTNECYKIIIFCGNDGLFARNVYHWLGQCKHNGSCENKPHKYTARCHLKDIIKVLC